MMSSEQDGSTPFQFFTGFIFVEWGKFKTQCPSLISVNVVGWYSACMWRRLLLLNWQSEDCGDIRNTEEGRQKAQQSGKVSFSSLQCLMWPNFPLSITNKPQEWCQGAREGEGGGAVLREKAEHKHNSNRNQLEPSKLFIHQMDTFPRDFTLKHSYSTPHTHCSVFSTDSTENQDNITLSKSFHVWFISTLKSGSPSTLWSHVCSFPQAQWRRNMLSILYLQRCSIAVTLSEGYYTNQRVLRDVCHVYRCLHLTRMMCACTQKKKQWSFFF